MAGEHLPEDIIVKILSKLPVKSLLRFRCVSKRWRSRVSDPQFARLQFKVACEQQTLSRRLLLSSHTDTSQFESLDLETTSFQANSSIRKLDFPFPLGSDVSLLCSCNGLVCVALDDTESFYIWNPSIGFTHRLPDPFNSSKRRLWHYGFGYVSATDDYNLFLVVLCDVGRVVQMFSLRARNWKKIEADPFHGTTERQGVLLNEALHWLNWVDHDYAELDSDDEDDEPAIIAFDLAREEFWKMPVPNIAGEHNHSYTTVGVSCDGCLYVIYSPLLEFLVSVEFWVMREYGKGDSWTKLFNLKTCNPPKQILSLDPVVVMQTSAVLVMRTDSGLEVVRIDHHEEKLGETSAVAAIYIVPGNRYDMIRYEESLFWLSDYLGVEETMVTSKRPHKAEIGEE